MTSYRTYLEVGEDGKCFAHVIELLGCHVRAETRQAALEALPGAIGAYLSWLRRHAEPAPPITDPIGIEIGDIADGIGPFNAGDAAAIFPPDCEPLSDEGMESMFRLMGHARSDLLALVRDLDGEILDWEAPFLADMRLPDAHLFCIRGLLHHVGDAEEWYVSRVIPLESLPVEWEDDEDLEVLEYLDMVRRSAVARLKEIRPGERSAVHHTSHWTDHPEEAWTVPKVLRRFLEHEFEHTAQIRERLSVYRAVLLARLATERANLLQRLLGLGEGTLTQACLTEIWTVKDMLAHLAAWDRWQARTMKASVEKRHPDFSALEDFDTANADFIEPWHSSSLDEVLLEVQQARSEWVEWMECLPEEEFFRARSYAGDDWTFPRVPLRVMWEHDADHAAQIASWRQSEDDAAGNGCKAVLSAALAAARAELLAAVALVPREARSSLPVCGDWTLRDLIGHLADWEWVGVDGLLCMAEGRAPQVEHIEDVDVWNDCHVRARSDQSWSDVWKDLAAARQALRAALYSMEDASLNRRFDFPWGGSGTAYDWLRIYVHHDREHARDLLPSSPEDLASGPIQ